MSIYKQALSQRKKAAGDLSPEDELFQKYYNEYINSEVNQRARNRAVNTGTLASMFPGAIGGAMAGGGAGYALSRSEKGAAVGGVAGGALGLIVAGLVGRDLATTAADKSLQDEAWRYAAMRSGKPVPSKTLV